jgi:hypothetical protein
MLTHQVVVITVALTTRTLYLQKLALTSLTCGSLSVGVVHLQTKATEGGCNKDILLFVAPFFGGGGIKASLVTGNFWFNKSLKYSKTEASVTGFLPYCTPEKDLLLVRHENSFVLYFTNGIHMLHLLYTFYQLHDYLSFQPTE